MTLESMSETARPPAEHDRGLGGAVGGAAKAAGWAARCGWGVARRLPGGGVAERGLQQLERTALTELRKRLDSADGSPYPHPLPYAQAPEPGGDPVITTKGGFVPMRSAMAGVLERSRAQTPEEARVELYAAVLELLTPDEARIVAALGSGAGFPLIDVVERGRTRLRNASTVGQAAGVTLEEEVPTYVTRLIGFGLAERDDESTDLGEQYDALLTTPLVREALISAKRSKPVRRTLRATGLGRAFWQACDPQG
ncbi:hypothetical protein [Nocardioides speluncae]|uniref:Abi-alpha family protein n=1 Tax=Nocardioides speluncae TaxID=2670337 RepID=UPI00198064C8|nr:hypothetical protein [Nocardioides speluncae]